MKILKLPSGHRIDIVKIAYVYVYTESSDISVYMVGETNGIRFLGPDAAAILEALDKFKMEAAAQ